MKMIFERIKTNRVAKFFEKIKLNHVPKIIEKYKTNQVFRHMVWITLIYFVTHWFLIVATGKWWDDWCYADKNWDYLFEAAMQSSLPSRAFILGALWLFPDGFYRIITFFLFYFGSILFYHILRKIDLFSNDACLWIVLLYITVPINDARITWICFGYSLGLFNFWLSFYLATVWKNSQGRKRKICRIVSLLFLFICFDTESTMMLTLLILFYFYYEDLKGVWNWKEMKKTFISLGYAVLHYLDYLILPIAWYYGDKLLFPGYGVYDGHSYIIWKDLPDIISNSPQNAYLTFKNILSSYHDCLYNLRSLNFVLFVVCLIVVLSIISEIKKVRNKVQVDNKSYSFFNDIMMGIIGIVIFFIGFFPYDVKRNTDIANTFTYGRDSLLLGIGVAIMMYYGVRLVLHRTIYKPVVLSLVLIGIIHFNCIYLKWQEAYYQQLQFQHEIAHNDEIRNNDTFLVMIKGDAVHATFYQFNGNSWAVTGEETRLFLKEPHDLPILYNMSDDSPVLRAYGMRDYSYGDKNLDGIIFLEYNEVPRKTLLKQKYNEFFNKASFDQWIEFNKKITYLPITNKDSEYLIWRKKTKEKGLNSDMIWRWYYPNNTN